MKRMYLFFAVTVMALFAVDPVSAQYQIPHGFVTYSKGNAYDRVLCRVEIAPGMTFEEIHATEQQICEKGKLGGDVEGQISFDGKWRKQLWRFRSMGYLCGPDRWTAARKTDPYRPWVLSIMG